MTYMADQQGSPQGRMKPRCYDCLSEDVTIRLIDDQRLRALVLR